MNYIEILRRFVLGEYGGVNNNAAQNEDAARQALADLLGMSKDDPLINTYIRDAAQIVGPNLSPGQFVTTPTITPDLAYATENGDDTGSDFTGGGTDSDFFVRSPRSVAEERFLAEPGGTQASFRNFMERFSPGATGFLRSGLEQRFDPMETAFDTMTALGTLPGRVAGQLGQIGEPINFRQWMENYKGGVPTQGTWQSMVGGVSDWLTGGRPTEGPTAGGQSFMVDPTNQFNLALQSILQNVPYNLRGAASRTASREFERFRAQNPDRMDEWLPAWQAQGQRWNPTLGPATASRMGI